MRKIYPDDDAEQFDNMPESLLNLWETWGFVMADQVPPAVRELYERNYKHGRCLLCTSPLGGSTVVVMDVDGIQAMFCGMACWQDMNILHWLQEVYDDLGQTVKVRAAGGEHGEAEAEREAREATEAGEEAQEADSEEAEPAGDPTDPREDEPEGQD